MIDPTSSFPPAISDTTTQADTLNTAYPQTNLLIQTPSEKLHKSKLVKVISILFWILTVLSILQLLLILAIPHVISFISSRAIGNSGFFPLDYSLILSLAWGILVVPVFVLLLIVMDFLAATEVANRTRKSWWLALITVLLFPIVVGIAMNILVVLPLNSFSNQGMGNALEPALPQLSSVFPNSPSVFSIVLLVMLFVSWKRFNQPSRTYPFPKKKLVILIGVGVFLIVVNTSAILGQTYFNDKGLSYVTREYKRVPLQPMELPSNLEVERYVLTENKGADPGEDPMSVQTVISTPITESENFQLIIVRETKTDATFDFEKKVASYLNEKLGETKTQIPIPSALGGVGYLMTKPLGDGELVTVVFQVDSLSEDAGSYITVISPRSSVEDMISIASNLRRNLNQETQKQ